MSTNTEIKDNWILESVHSINDDFSNRNQVFLEVINSKIKERTKANLISNTFFEDGLNRNLFNAPELFNKTVSNYKNYISKSQNWVGHVIELNENEFTAKLIDKNDPTTFEIAQFDIAEVSKGDMGLLKLGGLFYWSVGFANQNGQIIKQSFIRFKRSADFTVEELDGITDRAKDLNDSLNWD